MPIILYCLKIQHAFSLTRFMEEESSCIEIWGAFGKQSEHSDFNEVTEIVVKETNTTWILDVRVGNYSKTFPVFRSRVKVMSNNLS